LENPDTIGIELDENRLHQLLNQNQWNETSIGEIIAKGNAYLFLLTILLTNLQRRLGQNIGIKPGQEMMEAIKIANEKNIPISLLDRNINITMKRAIQEMTIIEKLKLVKSIIQNVFSQEKITINAELVEKMKEKDTLTQLIDELGKEMPSIKKVLVDERDAFIAQRIMDTPGRKIVAVVGAGHVQGIKKYLGKETKISEINTVKPSINWLKIISYSIPLIFFTMLALLIINKGPDSMLKASLYWILATGSLSAIGALIARAHPITIISAFLSAPFTTLHPLLAVGFVTAYVETKLRNPKVKDFENLRKLDTLEDFTKNQVTRILLIMALSNLGATIGVAIAFPTIATMLG
jgi:pheromone shutdown-related protein TraB